MVLSGLSPEILAPLKFGLSYPLCHPGFLLKLTPLFLIRDFNGFSRFFARNSCSISHPFFLILDFKGFIRFFARYSCSHMPETVPGFLEFPTAMHRNKGFQMWSCSACRGNAKDSYVFSGRCPCSVSVPVVVHRDCLWR